MNHDIEAPECSQCEKKIRPPFKICSSQHLICPYCQKHSINGVEDPVASDVECTEAGRILTSFNAIFKNLTDYCQFKCGFMGPLLELQDHEATCIKQKKNINCYIRDCTWSGTIDNLISHFDVSHKDQLIDHSTLRSQEFKFSFQNEGYLVIMFKKDYFCNEIYWMRFLEEVDNRYIMMQYQGRIGKFIEPAQKWDTFDITFVENQNYHLVGNICFSPNSRDRNIMDDEVVKMFGVSLNICKSDNIIIGFINSSLPIIPSFLIADLECNVCTEMMSEPIRMCASGHSMCSECASKLVACAMCQSTITQSRNYSMEQIAGRISTCCPYRSNGCMFRFPFSDRETHIKQCLFRPMKECVLECYDTCDFEGVYNDLINHWETQHGLVYKNSVTYLEEVPGGSSPDVNLFSAMDESFIFIKESTPAYFLFSLSHLTHEYTSSFHYDVKLSNPVTGHAIRYCLPFATTLNGVTQHQIPIDVMYNIICDNKKYNVKVNIFKK